MTRTQDAPNAIYIDADPDISPTPRWSPRLLGSPRKAVSLCSHTTFIHALNDRFQQDQIDQNTWYASYTYFQQFLVDHDQKNPGVQAHHDQPILTMSITDNDTFKVCASPAYSVEDQAAAIKSKICCKFPSPLISSCR